MKSDQFVEDRPARLARSLSGEPPPPSEQENLLDGKLVILDNRFVRDAPDDKLVEFANRMQLIARIVNGISLQSGLINAEIPVDDVIAELLHMGSMKLKDLIVIPDTDITRVMDMMKKSTTKLVKTKNVTEIEDGLLVTNSVRSEFDFAAFEKMFVDDYTSQIGKVVNAAKTVDLSYIMDKIETLKNSLENTQTFNSDTDGSLIARERLVLETIHLRAVDIEKVFKNQQNFNFLLTSLNEMIAKSSFIHILAKVDKMIESQKTVKTDSDADANFKHFEQMSAFFDKNQKILTDFDNLLESLQSKYQSGVQYTAGFPKGCKDLDSLMSDIDDKWFQRSMKMSPGKAQSLKNGLRPLEEFKNNLKVVDEAWQPVKRRIGNARKVISQQIQIANQAKSAGVRSKKMGELEGCRSKLTNPPPPSITAIDPFLQSIRDVNGNVKEVAGILKFELANLSVLKNAVEGAVTDSIDDRKTATPGIVTKLKKMPEVPQTISNIDKFLADVSKLNNIVSTIDSQSFRNGLTTIQNHHTSLLNSGFKLWNDCLKNTVGAEGEVVKDMIESIRNVRLMAHTDIDAAESVLITVLKPGYLIRGAQKYANNMNTSKNSETKYLDLLKNSLKISLDLGLAAQGFAGIQQTDVNRLNLSGLTGDPTLTPHIAISSNISFSTEEMDSLKQLATLKPSLNQMFTEIDTLKPLIEKLKETDLNSYKPVFDAAAKVGGVKKMDVGLAKKTVAKMRQKSSPSDQWLQQVKVSLDTLDDLDLDFTKYQVARAPSALDAVQPFFAQLPESLTNAVSDGSSFPWIFLLAGLGGLAAVLFVCGALYFGVRNFKKRKEEEKKQREEANRQREAMLVKLEARKNNVASRFYAVRHMTKKIISAFRDDRMNPMTFLEKEILRYDKLEQLDVEMEKSHKKERRGTLMSHAEKSAINLQSLEDDEPSPYINANRMKMTERSWIMSQGPLDGSEFGKVCTMEQHWLMIDQYFIRVILQLCPFVETVDSVTKRVCGQYYPERVGARIKCGRYSVENVGKIDLGDQFPVDSHYFTAYQLDYTLKGKVKSVVVLRYQGWKDGEPPTSVDPALQMIKFADSFRGKVLVHCSTGVGRTGILVAIKKGLELSSYNEYCTMDMILTQLYECRHHALKKGIDILFITLAITKGIIKSNNYKEFVNFYPVLEFYYDRMRKGNFYVLNKEVEPGEYAVDLAWRDKYVDKITEDWKRANPGKEAEELSEEEEKEQPKPTEKTK